MLDKPDKNNPRTLRLNAKDNIIVAIDPVMPEVTVQGITATARIMRGHKMAAQTIAKGQPVLKFGQIIGFATEDIAPGAHVHTHNCSFAEFERDYAFAQDAREEQLLPPEARATFQGYRRANGKAGTRNYIGVLTSVNCSASVARFMAEAVTRSGILEQYPNIDGVVSFVHGTGCGLADKGEGYDALERTQWGYAGHPNLAAALVVGLGCEVFQISRLKDKYGLVEGDNFRTMTIQDTGGTKKTIEAGVARIKEMLPRANNVKRETISASELTLALQCGGSDGYSGITANPALGAAVDTLVRHGGTAVLSETPEIYGAEHLLTRRARTNEVGAEAGRHHRVVAGLLRQERRLHGQQPEPRQQAGRPHHHPGEIAGRGGQGRHHHAHRSLSLRRAGHGQGFRLHGHAGLRPRRRHRPGRGRLQRAVLHDGPRLGLRLQAHAVHQARHQPRHLQAHAR